MHVMYDEENKKYVICNMFYFFICSLSTTAYAARTIILGLLCQIDRQTHYPLY